MGNSNDNSGNITDVNFFSKDRNDIPTQTQPNGLQQEVYRDWQPAQMPGRIAQTTDNTAPNNGYVTIRDGSNIIYAQAGSTVIINEGQNYPQRVGGQGANGFIPNYGDTMANVQRQRMIQWEMQHHGRMPYYGAENNAAFQPNFRNVNGNGWEMPQPFVPVPYNNFNRGAFVGAHIGPFSIGFNLGGNNGGYYGGGFQQPFFRPRPPFFHGRGGGVNVAFGLNNSQSYYGDYANQQPVYEDPNQFAYS